MFVRTGCVNFGTWGLVDKYIYKFTSLVHPVDPSVISRAYSCQNFAPPLTCFSCSWWFGTSCPKPPSSTPHRHPSGGYRLVWAPRSTFDRARRGNGCRCRWCCTATAGTPYQTIVPPSSRFHPGTQVILDLARFRIDSNCLFIFADMLFGSCAKDTVFTGEIRFGDAREDAVASPLPSFFVEFWVLRRKRSCRLIVYWYFLW